MNVTFAIMAILIFGVAVSPIFSNGLAYAQERTEEDQNRKSEYTEKQKIADEQAKVAKAQEKIAKEKQKVSDAQKKVAEKKYKVTKAEERKQQARENLEERKYTAQSIQEQRMAELKAKAVSLKQKLVAEEKLDRERMQERMTENLKRSPMNDAMEKLVEAGVIDSDQLIEIVDDTTTAEITPIIQDYSDPQSNTSEQTQTYLSKLQDTILEQKQTQDRLFAQMTVLLSLVNSMCEDKVIVENTFNENYRCVNPSIATKLVSTGMVTLVQ